MKHPLKTLSLLLLLVLLLGACRESPRRLQIKEKLGWWSTEHSSELTEFFYKKRNEELSLFRFDPNAFSIQFKAGEAKNLEEWQSMFPNSTLLINGAYFKEDWAPAGFFISETLKQDQIYFDFDRSGLIDFSDSPQIIDTEGQSVDWETLENAAQSYPFLIKNGAPNIEEDSGLLARRSFIGTDTAGSVYIGVYAYGKLSLYELMLLLQRGPIEWQSVINLDGGPSTGLSFQWAGEAKLINSLTKVPNIILIQ